MSKAYLNQKNHISVVSGSIVSISEDRRSMQVTYAEYDKATHASINKTTNAQTMVPIPADYQAKDKITMIGGFLMDNFTVSNFTKDSACYEMPDLAVVTGHIEKVVLNEEKDEQGNPKLKKSNGQPRKPHFDIYIKTENSSLSAEASDIETHIIKVYDGKVEAGKPNNIERMQKRFAGIHFQDKESTPIRATIVTQPGQNWSNAYTNEATGVNEMRYFSSHMGVRSMDLELEYSLQALKTNENQISIFHTPTSTPTPEPAPAPAPAPTPEVAPPVEQPSAPVNPEPAPTPRQEAPTNEPVTVEGFDETIDGFEDDELYNEFAD